MWNERKDDAITLGDNKAEGQRTVAGGLLIDRRQAGDSFMYTLIKKNGEEVQMWGCAAIDSKFRPTDIGKFVRYQFIERGKTRGGREFKKVAVSVWDGEPEADMKEWPRFEEFQTYSQKGFTEPLNAPREEDPFGDEEDDAGDLPFKGGL